MTWRSAPASMVALRTMIGNSAAWVAAGGADAQVHFPDINPDTDTTLPRVALYEAVRWESVATGVRLPRSDITIRLDAWGRYSDAVAGADSGAGTFTVAADITSQIAAGDEFYVGGSTGNDGWYLASSVSFSSPNTTITVDTTGGRPGVADDTADGTIYTGDVEELADELSDDLLAQATGLVLRSGGREGPVQNARHLFQGEDAELWDFQIATLTFEAGLDS